MRVPHALAAAVLVIAIGAAGSRAVHVRLIHRDRMTIAEQDEACARWGESARLAATHEAARWTKLLPTGEVDLRSKVDGWEALYQTQRWYPDGAQRVGRPSNC